MSRVPVCRDKEENVRDACLLEKWKCGTSMACRDKMTTRSTLCK